MLTEIILETLKNLEWLTTETIFTDYWTSYRNLRRFAYYGGRPPLSKEQRKAEYERKQRQQFYNILYQLKKQGFIEKKKDNNKKGFWKLTAKGSQYLKIIKHRKIFLPLKTEVIKNDFLKVIVFDIPESEKKKREWLRQTLTNFNFSLLQKSVWIGETQLPEDFFNSLKELDLISYIHIFGVNKEKTGSLNKRD